MKLNDIFRFILWEDERPDFVYGSTHIVNSVSAIPSQIANEIFLVRQGGKDKWLVFNCPGGHRYRIEVNLMRSIRPCWSLKSSFLGSVSLYPSVDVAAAECGCHFWLKNSKAYMAKYFD